MKNKIKLSAIIFLFINVFAIGNNDYKMPPKAIADIVDAPATPGVSISPDKKQILIMQNQR